MSRSPRASRTISRRTGDPSGEPSPSVGPVSPRRASRRRTVREAARSASPGSAHAVDDPPIRWPSLRPVRRRHAESMLNPGDLRRCRRAPPPAPPDAPRTPCARARPLPVRSRARTRHAAARTAMRQLRDLPASGREAAAGEAARWRSPRQSRRPQHRTTRDPRTAAREPRPPERTAGLRPHGRLRGA